MAVAFTPQYFNIFMSDLTEKEKMLSGQPYNASDPGLVRDRMNARSLIRAYNATIEDDARTRQGILSRLFSRVGPKVEIEPPFYCDYGYNVFAGDGLYMNFGCVILDCNRVVLGEKVLCGPYVQIFAAYHPVEPEARSAGLELSSPVVIGDNVWIGGGSIICPGVTIGDNVTIGAGSVVVRDIPSDVVAAGNPCTVKRWI